MQQQRRQHQAELARQKNEETARRLASGGLGSGDGQGPNKSTGEINAYRNVDDIPARELKIHVSGELLWQGWFFWELAPEGGGWGGGVRMHGSSRCDKRGRVG